jgi:hypothetical protein
LESIPLERGFHLAEPRSRSKAASILDFDPIMPIECKRLPTPKAKDRDEREYVITEGATAGGIQRFKLG